MELHCTRESKATTDCLCASVSSLTTPLSSAAPSIRLSPALPSLEVASPAVPPPDAAPSPRDEPSPVDVSGSTEPPPCASPSSTPSSSTTPSIAGSVSSPVSPTSPPGPVPYKRRALLQANLRLDSRGGVRGVAELRGRMFIVVESSDAVQIYDRTQTVSAPYSRRDAVRIKGLSSPTDVVVCPDAEQLYIADGAKRCVWRIDVKTVDVALERRQSVVALNQWLKTPDFEPRTLSVRTRRVVVIAETSAWVNLFRADGKLLKRVPLPDGAAALHAVETERETFVISQVARGAKSRCQVSEIDCRGTVLRVFDGGRDGSTEQVLRNASYLALDRDGRVLVADTGNDRVVLLACDFGFERVLLTTRDDSLERKPWRMCLIEHTAQLVVGYCEIKSVTVYRVRPK